MSHAFSVAHLNARTSPVTRLPDEVLVDIFNTVVHATRTYEDEGHVHTSMYELEDVVTARAFASHVQVFKLACINRRWRRLVLDSSQLWSSVPVTIKDIRRGKIDLYRHRLVLTRSRSADLDVHIDARMRGWPEVAMRRWLASADDEPTHPFSSHLVPSLDLVLPHAGRWRSLTLLTDTHAHVDSALQLFSSHPELHPSRLRSLTLMHCADVRSTGHPLSRMAREPVFSFFGGRPLPHLKTLRLANVKVKWSDIPDMMARSGGILRTLDIRYHARNLAPTADQLRRILRKTSRLVRLKIHMDARRSDSISDGLSPDDPAHLSHLHTCEIGYADADSVPLLRTFAAPEAVDITLVDINPLTDPTTWDGSVALRSLAVQPGGEARFPNAQRLSLVNVSGPEESFRACYSSFPSVRSLFLHAPPMSALAGLIPPKPEHTAPQPEHTTSPDLVPVAQDASEIGELPIPRLKNVHVVASPAYASGIRAALTLREAALAPLAVFRLEPLVLPFFSEHASRASRDEADELVAAYTKADDRKAAGSPAIPGRALVSTEIISPALPPVSVPAAPTTTAPLVTTACLEEPRSDEHDGSETEDDDEAEALASPRSSHPDPSTPSPSTQRLKHAVFSERRLCKAALIRARCRSLGDDPGAKARLPLYPPPLPLSQASSFASLCPDSDDDEDDGEPPQGGASGSLPVVDL